MVNGMHIICFMNKQKILDYVIVILPIVIVAGLGTLFSNLGMSWFDGLTKPSQWVPDWIFPVVWRVIYVAFAVFWFIAELVVDNRYMRVLYSTIFYALGLAIGGLAYKQGFF